MPFEPDAPASRFVPDEAPALGLKDYLKAGLANSAHLAIPGGAAMKFLQALDHAAYNAGGKVTDVASNLGASPEVAAATGTAANVGIQTIPSLVGGQAMKPAAAASEWLGRRIMQSALKPNQLARTSGNAEKAITTLMDEGINATEGGAAALRDKISSLSNEVKTILQKYPEGTVDKHKVADALAGAYEKALQHPTPQADLKILDQAVNDFLSWNPQKIPVQQAQEMKQAVWKKLGERSFGKGLVPDAARDAEKSFGSGLRQGIEEVAPEVGPRNAKQGELINALKQVERRTGVEGNKNIIGLGALSPSSESALAWIIDRSPAAKSMLAHYLHSHFDPVTVGQVAGAGYGSMFMGRPEEGSLEKIIRESSR